MNSKMDVALNNEDKIIVDKTITARHYAQFKSFMHLVGSGINLKLDVNCDLVGSLVMALFTGNKNVKEVDSYEVAVLARGESNKLMYEKRDINLKGVKDQINSIMEKTEERKTWMPFLAALQLCVKTKDAILWQDNRTSKYLEVSPICEPFAVGYNVKNRLKKSRQLSFGPLVHLEQLLRLDRESGVRKRLGNSSRKQIRDRLLKTLNRQTVGNVQRAILKEIRDEKYNNLSSLCVSYVSIKPHIEHNWILPYPILANTEDFEGADFTSEWCWKKMKEAVVGIACPDEKWHEFLSQIMIHCAFQTSGEDLGALSRIFGRIFYRRKDFGKFVAKNQLVECRQFVFNYQVWTKPQRGAPRTIEYQSRGQICSRPSLRGTREALNNKASLKELEYFAKEEGTSTLIEALNKEFEEYKKVSYEGTGEFYNPNSEVAGKVTIQNSGIYLFSN